MAVRSQVTERLIEVLHTTIAEVEQTSGVAFDDPSLATLKQILLLRIADLEAERGAEAVTAVAPSANSPALDDLCTPTLPATETPE